MGIKTVTSLPFLEVLVHGEHLSTLVRLDVVPRCRVLLSPDDCTTNLFSASYCKATDVLVGPRASRAKYQVPPATTTPTTA